MIMAPNVKAILTADWHLGHPRTMTIDTAYSIKKYLFPKLTKEIDILFIAGDVFDGKLSMNSIDADIVIGLFIDIFNICFINDIIIRIVRGTYSHDQHQLRFITKLFNKSQVPVDFKAIDTLSIEHIDKLNIDVAYMPDNLPYSSKNEVLDHLRTLFFTTGINKVDYVIFHGEFDHLNFGPDRDNAYSVDDFKPLCSGLVLSGHEHKPCRHGNIIYAGSFNRLAHGEEEAKGFWLIDGVKTSFVENEDAVKYITVDYSGEINLETLLKRHLELIKSYNGKDGFLRVIISDIHLKQTLVSFHRESCSNIKLTFKNILQKTDVNNSFLIEKLNRKNDGELEIPSIKNVANIVYKHLQLQGVDIRLIDIELIINSEM